MEPELTSINHVANKSFDYVVVGGGTTGLCLASRLSEDPQVTVVVLEAGDSHVEDPFVDTPTGFFQQMGNSRYDWNFKTVPQKHLDNDAIIWNRGKGLGGSSNINYLTWTRPSKDDIDAWERLGNPGWNWERFIPYVKKCESFHSPSQETITREELGVDPLWFGQEGPISVSFSDSSSEAGRIVRETLKTRGIPTVKDMVNETPIGSWCAPGNVNPHTLTRSSAFTGYFLPNSGRKNLQVLTGACVDRLLFEESQKVEPISARGVEFRHGDKAYQVYVKQEVVLCAGALKSPQVLELSGIGDPTILEPLGIDIKLRLPGVGANVQDHISHLGLSFELHEGAEVKTLDDLSDPVERENHMKLYSQKRPGLLSLTISGLTFLPVQIFSEKAHAIVEKQLERVSKNRGGYPPGLFEQYDIQAERLKDPGLHECEILTYPIFGGFVNKSEAGKKYVSFTLALTSAWSRGTIHVGSKDPSAQPAMDPHYLEEDIDLELMIEAFKFARSLSGSKPFRDLVREVNPGSGVTSDAEIREHIKRNLGTLWHVASSLSMLPREKGGVVDPSLKVWGTKNIRVADISIIPLHVGVHTQTVAYGIAELAADIIRGRA